MFVNAERRILGSVDAGWGWHRVYKIIFSILLNNLQTQGTPPLSVANALESLWRLMGERSSRMHDIPISPSHLRQQDTNTL
jgi:hypothetical protein